MKLPRWPGSSADGTKIQELHLVSQAGVFIQQRGSRKYLLWGWLLCFLWAKDLEYFPSWLCWSLTLPLLDRRPDSGALFGLRGWLLWGPFILLWGCVLFSELEGPVWTVIFSFKVFLRLFLSAEQSYVGLWSGSAGNPLMYSWQNNVFPPKHKSTSIWSGL